MPPHALRGDIDLGDIAQVLADLEKSLFAELLVHHLTPAESLGDLDLVTGHEESACLVNADLHIVRVDLDRATEADFLELVAVGSRLGFFFGLLVLVLSVVHDLAHGRTRIRNDLDEIEPGGLSHAHCFGCLYDTPLFALLIDQSDR